MMGLISFLVYTPSIIGMVAIASIVAFSSSSRSRWYFAATIYSISVWLALQFITQFFSLSGLLGLRLVQIASAIALCIDLFFYGFIRSYLDSAPSKYFKFAVLPLFLVALVMNTSGLMIKEAFGTKIGIVVSSATQYYMVYISLIAIFFLISVGIFITKSIKNRHTEQRIGNSLLIFGFLQALVVLAVDNTIFASYAELQNTIPLSLLIMTISISLAIFRYQFFDIKYALVRIVAYALSLSTLSLVYYYIAYLVSLAFFKGSTITSISLSPINILLALLLAFIFQPVKRFFDKITDRFFYKDSYSIDDFFSNLNKVLAFTTDLRGLLERASYEIGRTLKSEQAFFFINTKNGHYVCAGTSHHKQLPKLDAERLETASRNGEVIVATLRENGDPIRRLMVSHRIEIVLPLVRSKKTIGFLCVGDSLSSGYTGRDVKVLKTVSEELIIAIQNALAVEEIRDFNENLQQRINNATKELRASNATLRQLDKVKDEFVGMASHQLRTPLTSVKGYISMVLDGDAGKITADQRKFLNEAYVSSEHMVALINDFLNVSRLQTGKFVIEKTKFDLSKVVGQEIDILQPNAKARGLRYEYIEPKNFPLVEADEAKIRQVIMNFADNALYYSRENSTIKIMLTVEGENAIYKVQDTGIGVPINEQSKLFTKFFRATNARRQRPDGTGVGLYLAKKIIESHGGKIIFESVEGKGSTFGFSLPISK